jgi:hypothetical protein
MGSARFRVAIFCGFLMSGSAVSLAASFQNLDFEQATVVAASTPVVPSDAFEPIDSA